MHVLSSVSRENATCLERETPRSAHQWARARAGSALPRPLAQHRWLSTRWLLARPSRPAPAGSCCNADIPSLWEAAATPPALPALGSASTIPSSRSACAGHGLGPGRRWKPQLWSHLGVRPPPALEPRGDRWCSRLFLRGNLRPPRSWLFNKTKGSRAPSCLCQHFHPLPFTGSKPHGKLGDAGPAEASSCRAGARRGGPRPSVLQSGCVGRCTCT